jgi:hypothetical protein
VVIGGAHSNPCSDRESYGILLILMVRGVVIGGAHSNPCRDRESYGILLVLLVGVGPTSGGIHACVHWFI